MSSGWAGNLLLTPIGEPAYRITALSLIAVAVAAAATVALARRLTGSTIIAVAAAWASRPPGSSG